MKSIANHIRFAGSLAAVAAVTALCSTTVAAPSGDKETRHSFIFSTTGDPVQPHSKSHTVAIQNIDGKITVKVNGKQIPADRIKYKDRRVIIFDEDGKEMAMGNIWIGDDDEHRIMPWVMRFHDADGMEEIADLMRLLFNPGFNFDFGGSSFEHPKVMLGIQLAPPGEALEIHLRLDPDSATMISQVYEGLAADEAGLEKYDIIVAINGDDEVGSQNVRKVLSEKEPGEEITLTIIHKGKKRKVHVELQAYDAAKLGGLHLGLSRILMIPSDGEDKGFGFRFEPGAKEWRNLLIAPRRGELFRRLPSMGEGGFQLHLNEELMKHLRQQLGDDAAQKLHDQLREHFPDAIRERLRGDLGGKLHRRSEAGHKDSRIEALNERLEELKRMLDKLVEEAEELDDGEV